MKTFPLPTCRAYTIVEALVAAGLLLIGIAAAACLALTMVSQEEANARVAQAFNMQEQAGRLYQLGMEPSEITALLPYDAAEISSLDFTTNTLAVTNVGTVETADCEMVFTAGSSEAAVYRTNTIMVVRPVIR